MSNIAEILYILHNGVISCFLASFDSLSSSVSFATWYGDKFSSKNLQASFRSQKCILLLIKLYLVQNLPLTSLKHEEIFPLIV